MHVYIDFEPMNRAASGPILFPSCSVLQIDRTRVNRRVQSCHRCELTRRSSEMHRGEMPCESCTVKSANWGWWMPGNERAKECERRPSSAAYRHSPRGFSKSKIATSCVVRSFAHEKRNWCRRLSFGLFRPTPPVGRTGKGKQWQVLAGPGFILLFITGHALRTRMLSLAREDGIGIECSR